MWGAESSKNLQFGYLKGRCKCITRQRKIKITEEKKRNTLRNLPRPLCYPQNLHKETDTYHLTLALLALAGKRVYSVTTGSCTLRFLKGHSLPWGRNCTHHCPT